MRAATGLKEHSLAPIRLCGRCDRGYIRVHPNGMLWIPGNSPCRTRLQRCTCRTEPAQQDLFDVKARAAGAENEERYAQ